MDYKIIVFVILAIMLIKGYEVYQHEQVHKQIDLYFGCEEVKVSYNLIGANTECINGTSRDIDKEYMLHSMNEIFSYNMDALMMFMFIIGLGIIIAVKK